MGLKNYQINKAQIVRAVYSPILQKKSPSISFGDDHSISIEALWNSSEIRLALSSVKSGKYIISSDFISEEINAVAGTTFFSLSKEKHGIEICDVGQYIPLQIRSVCKDSCAVFDGFLLLDDCDKIYSLDSVDIDKLVKNQQFKAFGDPERTQKDTKVAIENFNGKLRVYDKYLPRGKNIGFTSVISTITDISTFSSHDKDWTIDMDINVKSFPKMDYNTVCNPENAYGLSFIITTDEPTSNIYFGIQRNAKGQLYLYINRNRGFLPPVVISPKLNETFKLSVKWFTDNMIAFFVNGNRVMYHKAEYMTRNGFSPSSLKVRWCRSRYEAKSDNDSLDVTVRNLNVMVSDAAPVTTEYGKEMVFSGEIAPTIAGTDIYVAPCDLAPVTIIKNEKYGTISKVCLSSSDESVLTPDGRFIPSKSTNNLVTLNAKILHGDNIAYETNYKFFVLPEAAKSSRKALVSINDTDPFSGRAKQYKLPVLLNTNFNSVVYDMGKITDINRVALTTAADSIGFINKNYLSLYVSDDNQTYSYVRDFSLLRTEKTLYIYNFNTKARYVKVHSTTNGLGNTGNIINSPVDLIKAYYSKTPLLAKTKFRRETYVYLTNDYDNNISDKIFILTLKDMGINSRSVRSDMSDIRFELDGNYLPHYYSDGKFAVRVFNIGAKETLRVRVLYGNKNAESVSDGNETYEIQYGTKHTRTNYEKGWFNSVATMPNGDLLRIVTLGNNGKTMLAMYRSKNGGLTWSDEEFIPRTDMISECGGFIVDNKNCKVFYFAFAIFRSPNDPTDKYCRYHIFESDDNGYTWSGPTIPVGNALPAPEWALSYSDGITLSCEDGNGPNVDYVFTTGAMRDIFTEAFCTTSIYSRDGGKSWIFSDSRITYDFGSSDFHEGGLSEETVIEQSDGTLVFFARCQISEICHFAVSRSYDHGITWNKPTLSNIYTTNTQPIISRLNGTPIFLWGGNNTMGGTTYLRYPLNLAYSKDDGSTFTGIIDASFQSIISTFNRSYGMGLHTNPDITFCKHSDIDMAYIVSTRHQMYILNVEDHIYKTKGAFDSFESGVSPEGWQSVNNTPLVTTTIGATDRSLAMKIPPEDTVVRSLHYIEKGSVSFDLFVENFGKGFTLELQSGFNDIEAMTAPVQLRVGKNGILCIGQSRIKLKKGNNHISIDFDCKKGKYTLYVNGRRYTTDIDHEDSFISYAVIFTKDDSSISLDKFIAIKNS